MILHATVSFLDAYSMAIQSTQACSFHSHNGHVNAVMRTDNAAQHQHASSSILLQKYLFFQGLDETVFLQPSRILFRQGLLQLFKAQVFYFNNLLRLGDVFRFFVNIVA